MFLNHFKPFAENHSDLEGIAAPKFADHKQILPYKLLWCHLRTVLIDSQYLRAKHEYK